MVVGSHSSQSHVLRRGGRERQKEGEKKGQRNVGKKNQIKSKKRKELLFTSSPGLSFLSTLQNLVLQLSGAVVVLLVAFLSQFSDAKKKVVDILGPVGVGGRG